MNTAEHFEHSIVRILAENGQVVGAGFLVSERRVLTCAHVVAQALGVHDDVAESPQAAISLDLPLVAPGQCLAARVVLWQPAQPDGRGDIAGLELQDAPPTDAKPARLMTAEDLWKHPFRAFGFPRGHENGAWASGQILGREATGWLQIEDIKQTGYFVAPGFSGGPAWDETLGGVVGIIVAADTSPGVRAAFIIPADRLLEAWPELARPTFPSELDLASIEIAWDRVDNYYVLHRGVRHQIPNRAEATLRDVGMMLGRRLADRKDLSLAELAQFTEGQPLPDTTPWIAHTREDGKLYWIKPRIELTEESGKPFWAVVNQKREIVNEQTREALAGDVPPVTVLRQDLDRFTNLGHIPDYFGTEAEQARPRLIQGKEWGHQYLQIGRIWRHIPYGVKLQTVGTIGEPVEQGSEKELDQEQIEGVPVQSAEWLVELWTKRGAGSAPLAAHLARTLGAADTSQPAAGVTETPRPGKNTDTMQENKYDLQIMRELLSAAFSDEEITTLAFDRFREVYDDFSGGMSKSEKIRRLVDWCDRNLQVEKLMAETERRNPNQYRRYAARLRLP
jgi:hypothetical protein